MLFQPTPTDSFAFFSRNSRALVRWTATVLLASATLGCIDDGSGVIEQRRFNESGFDSLVIEDGFRATVLSGREFSVQVFADDNFIDDVEVEREGDTLHVEFDRDHARDATLEVEITMPRLSRARLEDGSSLLALEMALAPTFTLELEDGSSARVAGMPGERLDEVQMSARDGSSLEARFASERTSVRARDGSRIALDGRGRALKVTGQDGSDVDTAGFLVEHLLIELLDGSYASASVSGSVEGELRGGSLLELAGDPQMTVDSRDGSSAQGRQLPD